MMTIAWGSSELITQYNYLSSGHWFSRGTMRFFDSRITSNYKRLSDTEALFITTEKAPNSSVRFATVRRARLMRYVCESDGTGWQRMEIDTVGKFNKLTLAQAKRLMGKTEVLK